MELNKDLTFDVNENLSIDNFKYYDKDVAVDNEMMDIKESLEKSIDEQMTKINVDSSIWDKMSQSQFKNILQNGIETALKTVLKKKLKISYSTFNDFKEGITAIMDGNVKEFIKKGTDTAFDMIPLGDATTRSAIKGVKNNVLDNVIGSEKYNIINRQTKVLNKMSKHCDEFNQAMGKNDVKNIKSKANAIKKDMKEILPIRETINNAQIILDKYELWRNKGEQRLSEEENTLIERLNQSA